MPSLAEYAKQDKTHPGCTFCSMAPELWDEIALGRKSGIEFKLIARWLQEEHNIDLYAGFSPDSVYARFHRHEAHVHHD